jgi:hypothetical protein
MAEQEMTDITAPQVVQIMVSDDGKIFWVNVDGVCRLRACRIGKVEIVDQRDWALRETLQAGLALIESADSHVSHGGPTKADAQKWILRARKALGLKHG